MIKPHFGYFLIIFIATTVAGCGGSSGSDGIGDPGGTPDIPVAGGMTLDTFEVTGTGVVEASSVPINAAVANGEFSFSFDVTTLSDPYVTELFISEDNLLDTTDVSILHRICGNDGTVFKCNAHGEFNCSFNSSNEMSCGVVGPGNFPKNLTTFLDSIPKDAHLILEACNFTQDECDTKAVAVEIQ